MKFYEFDLLSKHRRFLRKYRMFGDNEIDALSKVIDKITFKNGYILKIKEI